MFLVVICTSGILLIARASDDIAKSDSNNRAIFSFCNAILYSAASSERSVFTFFRISKNSSINPSLFFLSRLWPDLASLICFFSFISSERVGFMLMAISRSNLLLLPYFAFFLLMPPELMVFILQLRAYTAQVIRRNASQQIPTKIQSLRNSPVLIFSLPHKALFKFLCKIKETLVSWRQCLFADNCN